MNNTQHEQIFTDLAPAQAAVVEGGAGEKYFDENFRFDYLRSTRSFYVRPGKTIGIWTRSSSASSNPDFNAVVRNVGTGNTTPAKSIRVNNGQWLGNAWTNMRGGNYKIDFKDTKDGVYVAGAMRVFYDY